MTIYNIPTQSFSLVHMLQHFLALTLCTHLLGDVWLKRVDVLHSFHICGSCKKMFDTEFVGMIIIYICVCMKWFLATWCLCEVFLKPFGPDIIKRWSVGVWCYEPLFSYKYGKHPKFYIWGYEDTRYKDLLLCKYSLSSRLLPLWHQMWHISSTHCGFYINACAFI